MDSHVPLMHQITVDPPRPASALQGKTMWQPPHLNITTLHFPQLVKIIQISWFHQIRQQESRLGIQLIQNYSHTVRIRLVLTWIWKALPCSFVHLLLVAQFHRDFVNPSVPICGSPGCKNSDRQDVRKIANSTKSTLTKQKALQGDFLVSPTKKPRFRTKCQH